jgi:hypothetical protein
MIRRRCQLTRAWIVGMGMLMVLAAAGAAGPAAAAPFDGSAPMLCAAMTVMDCDPKGECSRRMPEEVNLPAFVRVDVPGRTLASPDGSRTAEVKSVTRLDGSLILQGAQNGRGWTVAIVEESGKMSAGVADGEDAFAIYGACALAGR